MNSKSVSNIHTRFKSYYKEIRDIWESFNLVNYYFDIVHKDIKHKKKDPFIFNNLLGIKKKLAKDDTLGAISHLKIKVNPKRTLVDASALFEDYISFLIKTVYLDCPEKLKLKAQDTSDQKHYVNLTNLIIDCKDKEEMVLRLIEEKVMGIFYGNILDLFTKDKAKLGFAGPKRFNEQHYQIVLEKLKEINARRNIIMHNQGKIDRKYLKEVKDSKYKFNSIVKIDSNYLKDAISVFIYLSAKATEFILNDIYKTPPGGTLNTVLKGLLNKTIKNIK